MQLKDFTERCTLEELLDFLETQSVYATDTDGLTLAQGLVFASRTMLIIKLLEEVPQSELLQEIFFAACRNSHGSILRLFFDTKRLDIIRSKRDYGFRLASRAAALPLVQLFIEVGCEFHQGEYESFLATLRNGDKDVFRFALQHLQEHQQLASIPEAVFFAAASATDQSALQLLVQYRRPALDELFRSLHAAIAAHNTSTTLALCQLISSIDANALRYNREVYEDVFYVIEQKQCDLLQILVQFRVNISAYDNFAILKASRIKSIPCLEVLLAAGADPDASCYQKRATFNTTTEDLDVVAFLIKNGATIHRAVCRQFKSEYLDHLVETQRYFKQRGFQPSEYKKYFLPNVLALLRENDYQLKKSKLFDALAVAGIESTTTATPSTQLLQEVEK